MNDNRNIDFLTKYFVFPGKKKQIDVKFLLTDIAEYNFNCGVVESIYFSETKYETRSRTSTSPSSFLSDYEYGARHLAVHECGAEKDELLVDTMSNFWFSIISTTNATNYSII